MHRPGLTSTTFHVKKQSETRPEIFGTDVSSAIAQECTRTRGNLRTQLPTPDDTYE
ncbi:hypothetical protein JG687_00008516 [Phytophthora cactorum]|uniref:Uncharacterized protein n=1 Tax=Phytophthora cactorum TaxID=29920 RepID=A0A8T1UDM2_9STRA|nr:hypothetical protein JG687_00008516 [Phytophthora cactorum]